MQVGERYLGGRDQVEVPVPRPGLEEVPLELWEVARAGEGLRGDQVGGDDLPVDMVSPPPVVRYPPRVQIQHELNQGAFQPGPQAPGDREARAGDLGRPLEI